MQIDLKTGLPEVPEGMFWRVREVKYTFINHESDASIVVELINKFEVAITEPRVLFNILGVDVTWGTRDYQKVDQTVVSYASVWNDEAGDGKPSYTRIHELTSEKVLKAAETALEKWKRQNEGESLLGTYPPKKLEVKTDD